MCFPLQELRRPSPDGPAGVPELHTALLYDGDAQLAAALAAHVEQGLLLGEPVVLVVTAAHRAAAEAVLAAQGTDVGAATGRGDYLALDAATTLAGFHSVAGGLDQRLFAELLGNVLTGAARDGQRVRVFGEMVFLLWSAGDAAGALALEHLWRGMFARHDLRLLCGYPAAALAQHPDLADVDHVRHVHASLAPPLGWDAAAPADTGRGDDRSRVFVLAPGAVRAARLWVGDVLADWDLRTLSEDAVLIASELAGNAVRHAGSSFRVRLVRTGVPGGAEVVRASVEDLGGTAPVLREPDPERPSGRGMVLVQMLARSWGSQATPQGQTVWAELAS